MVAKPIDTVLRRLGVASACACLAAAGLAAPSRGAELVDVRVGVHPGFTRVVFELDAEAGYSVARPATGGATDELVVDLAAHSLRRVITSRSDLVETVRIEPGESGSVARIGLRGGAIQATDMLLLHPPRIVIDLRKPSPVVAAAEPPSAAEEPSEPVSATREEAAEAVGEAPEGTPLPEDGIGEAPAGEVEAGEGAPGLDAAATPETSDQTRVIDEHAQELAGGETSEEPAPQRAPAREPQPAAPITPDARRPVAAPGGAGTGLPAPFDDARVLVAAAGAALLLLLLLALRTRRRSRRSHLPEFPPFEEEPAPSHEPVVEARVEDELGALAVPRAQELRGAASPEPALRPTSIFDTPYEAPDEGALAGEPDLEPAPSGGSGLPATPAPLRAAGSESERRVEELERRVAHLEKRLEEVAEVKDRLDRQLTTQNEELRVQRAAIARTQRVLRNLSRPEDAATEPASKGPGSQPPGGGR